MRIQLHGNPMPFTKPRLLSAMRFAVLPLVLLLVLIPQILHAQSVIITIHEDKTVTVDEVFRIIKSQTKDYMFVYPDDLFKDYPRVQLKKGYISLSKLINQSVSNGKVSVVFSKNNIILLKEAKDKETIEVSGKVTDKNGAAIAGMNILVKGTQSGVVTDKDGRYTITVPYAENVLVFSFLGMKTVERVVGNGRTINVVMEEAVSELQGVELISTGYQKIKPEHNTGAVSSVQSKEYNSRINTDDFLTGIQNKIPGLLVNSDIEFEGNSLFHIRGISTINGNKKPLIVIDGYPTELSLETINPNEIESITVLKDAAAASIYGVRASNGVIVIERKQAKEGAPKVTFRSTLSLKPKENYERYRWDKNGSGIAIDYALDSKLGTSTAWVLLSNASVGSLFNYTPAVYTMIQQAAGVITQEEADKQLGTMRGYNNVEDYGKLFLRTAATQTYNMDVSGGNKNSLYYITANYTRNDASQIKTNNGAFMLSARTTFRFSDRFSLDLTDYFQQTRKNAVPIPDITSVYAYERFQDENGNPLSLYSGSNMNPYFNKLNIARGMYDNNYYPLVDINEVSDKTEGINNRFTLNFRWKLREGLDWSMGGVYEIASSNTDHLASELSSESRQLVNRYTTTGTAGLVFNLPKGSYLRQTGSNSSGYSLRSQFNYNKKIARDHALNVILGAEIRQMVSKSRSAAYFGYSDATLYSQIVDWTVINASSFVSPYARLNSAATYQSLFTQGYGKDRFISGYFNAVYSYQSKYSLSASTRVDQSNLFGSNPKYRYKPSWSVGTAWNMDKEQFVKRLNWVRSLKMRASLGFNGNVAKNVLPEVIAKVGQNVFDNTIQTLALSSPANSRLRWEQTFNFNAGIDFQIFKHITGNVDYYVKKSMDILANNEVDPTRGVSSAIINRSSLRNSGLEIGLHADWISRKSFNWNTGFVFSINSSKVLAVYNTSIPPNAKSYQYAVGNNASYLQGYGVGSVFVYRYAGIDSKGAVLITDKDGNTKNFDQNDKGVADVDYKGTTIPAYNIGFSNRVDVGRFYAYAMINYFGRFVSRLPIPDPSAVRPLEGAGNYWRVAGDENKPGILPALKYSNYNSYFVGTDRFVVNGDYFTLADVTVSYSLKGSKVTRKLGLSDMEVKAQASNLYTIGLNDKHFSPATRNYAKSYLTPVYTMALQVFF